MGADQMRTCVWCRLNCKKLMPINPQNHINKSIRFRRFESSVHTSQAYGAHSDPRSRQNVEQSKLDHKNSITSRLSLIPTSLSLLFDFSSSASMVFIPIIVAIILLSCGDTGRADIRVCQRRTCVWALFESYFFVAATIAFFLFLVFWIRSACTVLKIIPLNKMCCSAWNT